MSIKIVNNVVDKDKLQAIYASRLQAMFGKFARSITLAPTTVSVQFNSSKYWDAPAWSTDSGLVVVHDPDSGSLLSINNLTRLKGLVIHELSHLLYTPRSRTQLARTVNERNQGNAFNILEDNRIENFMVSRMSGVKPWLVHTITTEMLKDPTGSDTLLPLVWGRKYLPESVRKAAYTAWDNDKDSGSAKEVARIIDQYIVLTLHDKDEIDLALKLVGDLHHILFANDAQSLAPSNHAQVNASAATPVSDGSKPVGKRDVSEAKQDVAEQIADQGNPEDTEDTDDADDSTGSSTSSSPSLAEALSQAQASARAAVSEDIKSTIETIKSPESSSSFSSDVWETRSTQDVKPASKYWVAQEAVSPEAQAMSKLFARELAHIRADFDPGWVRKSDQGKLNVRDYMMGADFDEAFDQWDQGMEEATDIECVILLDNSGSMDTMITPAYEAMWAIKRALDSIDASTTVIQYGSWGNYLYQAHEKAMVKMTTARREGGGSTNPLSSLRKTSEILQHSSRAIKMMLMITDGQWANPSACEQVIATLRNNGVVTGFVYLQPADTPEIYIQRDETGTQLIDAHCCEAAVMLTEPRQIVDFAKQLTKVSRERLLTY
jgi:hypothetical protein